MKERLLLDGIHRLRHQFPINQRVQNAAAVLSDSTDPPRVLNDLTAVVAQTTLN